MVYLRYASVVIDDGLDFRLTSVMRQPGRRFVGLEVDHQGLRPAILLIYDSHGATSDSVSFRTFEDPRPEGLHKLVSGLLSRPGREYLGIASLPGDSFQHQAYLVTVAYRDA